MHANSAPCLPVPPCQGGKFVFMAGHLLQLLWGVSVGRGRACTSLAVAGAAQRRWQLPFTLCCLQDAEKVAGTTGSTEQEAAAAAAVQQHMQALDSLFADAAAPSLMQQLLRELDGPKRTAALRAALRRLLPEARPLAEAMQRWWALPSQAAAGEGAELARAAAGRPCANLRCANLADPGRKSKRCAACLAVRYW